MSLTGNLNKFDTLNVFNRSTYGATADPYSGAYSISIIPNTVRTLSEEKDVGVNGIMKNNIQFSMKPDWQTLGLDSKMSGMTPNSGILQGLISDVGVVLKGAHLAGTSVLNSGLFTRKYYNNSGWLTISPEFRVIHSSGSNNQCLLAAYAMMSMSIPRISNTLTLEAVLKTQMVRDVVEKIKSIPGVDVGTKVVGEAATLAGRSIKEFADSVGGEGTGKKVGNVANKAKDEVVKAKVNWTESPSPVNVKIGNFFDMSNMVIEDLQISFSEEMADNGPLYADFTVSLSTREALVVDDNGMPGLNIRAPKSKVSMVS
jgi:hypothetical protein